MRWDHDHELLIASVAPDHRAQLASRTQAQLDTVLERLMADEVAALDRFGQGVAAVVAGNRWYSALVDAYSFAWDRPPFASAVARLQARRGGDLRRGARDRVRARGLFSQACADEHGAACYNAAVMLQYGYGGPRDTARAQSFYAQGCGHGHEDACTSAR
jgi:hypothetical protein